MEPERVRLVRRWFFMPVLSIAIRNRKKALSLWLLALAGLAALVFLIGMAMGWQSPVDREALRGFLERAQATPYALPAIILVYIAASAVLFPVTVLNLLMAMVFGPVWGVFYGLGGAMIAAALYFWLGRLLGRRHLRRLMGARAQEIDERIGRTGVIGVMLVRFLPVAPFTLVNLAAGVSAVRFLDYLIGTFLALLPGAAARGLVGDSLTQIVLNPSRETALYLGGGLVFWAAIVYATFRLTRYLRARQF